MAEFNELSLLLTVPGTLDPAATELVLQGTTTRLQAGDVLLLASADAGGNISAEPTVVRVTSITEGPPDQLTTVDVMAYSGADVGPERHEATADDRRARHVHAAAFSDSDLNSRNVASTFSGGSYSGSKVAGILEQKAWGSGWVDIILGSQLEAPPTLPAAAGVFALRQHAAVFGANAPAWNSNLSSTWSNDWDGPTRRR